MNSKAENILIDKVAIERDQIAYKHIFLTYYQSLTRFAIGFVKTREAAEEVVSDVMLKVWALNEKFAGVVNLPVYLYAATRNRSLNYLRDNQKNRFKSIEEAEEIYGFEFGTPEKLAIEHEWSEAMHRAITSLPPKCRMVYKLVREDGFTYKEVAAIVGISENTVDRHLNNALHKLVKALKVFAVV